MDYYWKKMHSFVMQKFVFLCNYFFKTKFSIHPENLNTLEIGDHFCHDCRNYYPLMIKLFFKVYSATSSNICT